MIVPRYSGPQRARSGVNRSAMVLYKFSKSFSAPDDGRLPTFGRPRGAAGSLSSILRAPTRTFDDPLDRGRLLAQADGDKARIDPRGGPSAARRRWCSRRRARPIQLEIGVVRHSIVTMDGGDWMTGGTRGGGGDAAASAALRTLRRGSALYTASSSRRAASLARTHPSSVAARSAPTRNVLRPAAS